MHPFSFARVSFCSEGISSDPVGIRKGRKTEDMRLIINVHMREILKYESSYSENYLYYDMQARFVKNKKIQHN
jgi:hypothetical protein